MNEMINVSVRPIVEYAFRRGSIDARFRTATTMTEGTRLHQMIQKTYGEHDKKEVPFETNLIYEEMTFHIEGRCDGLLKNGEQFIIDEIKSTSLPLIEVDEGTHPVYWAQAKCYGYMAVEEYNLEKITIQLTYIQSETNEIIRYQQETTASELNEFMKWVVEQYAPFARWKQKHLTMRDESSKALTFPYDSYREGQRKLAASVYKTVQDEATLFATAPTGIGKTISTLFPVVKAMGEGYGNKIFYLTAKTITRETAQEAFELMETKGLHASSVTITARDKICFKEKTICEKEYCEYANGYYDRINDGMLDILHHETRITREVIEKYAHKHRLCPFELSLDLSYMADAVICDYNYLYDPRVSLKRLIEEQKKQTTVLIDEAHNLVDRAREMYSAELMKSPFLELKRNYKRQNSEVSSAAASINNTFITYRKSTQNGSLVLSEIDEELIVQLDTFVQVSEVELLQQKSDELLLETYFLAQNFIRIAKLYDQRYMTYVEAGKSEVKIKFFCFDPSHLLQKMRKGFRSNVFFSATFTPFSYYQNMLGWKEEDYAVKIPSPFPREHANVYIAPLSTKYRDRERTLPKLVTLLQKVLHEKPGNYLFFFPSYGYMEQVFEAFTSPDEVETVIQQSGMTEEERESFLKKFTSDRKGSLVGFAVVGGIFSEGIDLKGDRLTGVVVVGVGLPNFDTERQLMKSYFDQAGRNGFEYTYVYPGMNRVQQAGGRLIRTETDRGLLLLIDRRYLEKRYQQLLPYEWQHFKLIQVT
ncbi:ATP-dependent DNA helicase [Guptibacillus hwajinpoensis]|uniref:ATP-dependent DNA helicase n=1 Tax=Guptibacillus hwajinpoensis TaxID=208199 RepID=UPI001CFDE96C|nr:ATP-dependent DNA helicase [Pseudalkalibacillus hwajinpoensis]WLR60106.1 ATP-dependent DNA helicase [Pseudalkalibacillus hwajinpoensis]